MIAELKGPTFGPYRCSNCMMTQPNDKVPSHCMFCGNMFSNYEDILIEEDGTRFLLHMKESKLRNESNLSRKN